MHNRINPRFTFITVTRNAADVLEDTIQSIITQTYKNIEYIIMDGASTDGTLSIAERYREHIAFLKSEPDKGLYDAMNKAMKLATGDYLCFLNAGDCLHEDDTLQQMVHSIQAQGNELPEILYGQTAIVNREGHFLHMRRLAAPEQLTWKSFRQGMSVCHQAFFVRHTLLEPYDLRYRFSADFDWCIRMMKKARTLHNTRLTLIDYLNEGMTTRNHWASLKERFRIMTRHYGLVTTTAFHIWFVVRAIVRPSKQ